MLANLTPLEIITYRAALALQFSDVITGKRVTDGMVVRAWAFDPAEPQLCQRYDEAEESPNSGVYGFRTLPGLEGYQIGDSVPAGSLSFIVTIEDRLNRYLPQTIRYDLPLANPTVQHVPLYSSPIQPTPTGYGAIRVQLLRTTSPTPPQVTVIEPAAWARIAVSVPADNAGDPPNLFHGLADGRGTALILVPYPIIPTSVVLYEAEWTVSVTVEHETAVLDADYDILETVLPDLNEERTPPFQTTLEAQSAANLFGTVTIVNVDDQIYNVVGPTNDTDLDFTLQFGRPLILRTQNDAAPNSPLSELLLESA